MDLRNDYFLPMAMPDYTDPQTQPVLTELLVYGVDFLDTRQIGNYFTAANSNYYIRKIIWLNDSSCRV